jgi:hypothetical protein
MRDLEPCPRCGSFGFIQAGEDQIERAPDPALDELETWLEEVGRVEVGELAKWAMHKRVLAKLRELKSGTPKTRRS